MSNCVSINLKRNEIIIKIAEDAEQKKIITELTKKLPDLKKLYKDEKTPIKIVGKVLKNKEIDEVLRAFKVKRSLSKKGCPYDNAVAEATYKIIKTEFTFNKKFSSLDELRRELQDYVQWYNNERIHSSLNYMTPINYRLFYTSS